MHAGSSHAERVLYSLNQQRAAGKFCDAAINVGDGALIYAHRNVLACFSELFQNPSSPTSMSIEIYLQECPSDGLELLLNFMYTGQLKLDANNLSQVTNAAASLCIPEALVLCQQFDSRSSATAPPPVKRKRGRPRKAVSQTTPYNSVKEENLLTDTKEEFQSDAVSAGVDDITSTALTTTTRSGRVVKGPRRLVTDGNPTIDLITSETSSKKILDIPLEKEGWDVVDHQNTDGTTGETQVAIIENSSSLKGQAAEGDDHDDDHDEEVTEDSDEDYVPDFQLASSAPCTSTSQRRKAKSDTMMMENGEDGDDQAKKDSVQCPICDKSFKSKYYLKVHNRRHTGEKPFGCSKCGKRYFRKENLIIHEIRDCSKVTTYSCTRCSSTFDEKEQLRLHMAFHTGDMPYKCSLCPEQFLYKKNLSFHMMKIHGFPKPHACPQCPKTFLTKTELCVHEAAKHRGEKPFVCEECGHRVSSRNGLQIHIKAIHRKEKPYICMLCGHAFAQKNNLNMHMRIHSGEKPYQCHMCGKTFRTQASLDKHHRTHTGERPFGCDICEQRFTEKGALVRHKASKHEEGRPHCCHVCSKTFKAKEQLRVHVRRHKGMRKFECNDCGYKFTRQAHLRRHIQIHKRTENYNPRQRKLRNVIVQDTERNSADSQSSKSKKTGPGTPEHEEGYVQHTSDSVRQSDVSPEHGSSCMMRVELEPSHQVMEVVVSDQSHAEASKSFSVPNVLEQSKLITEAYEFTVNMEDIAESVSERTEV